MKHPFDKVTAELPAVLPAPKKRGRPPTGNAMSAAERTRKHRETHNLRTLAVDIPSELFDALQEFMRFKDKTQSQVVSDLLTKQLLRKS